MSQKSIPKVAVITRTKDRNLLLERAIESVQKQTMNDFVQVVINDGGDKGSVEKLVSKFVKNGMGDRIVLVHNDKPSGHTPALNQGIKCISSKYIAILDDDDTWHPDYLKKTTEHLDSTGSKGVVTVIDRIIEKVEDDKIEFISKNRWRPDIQAVSLYGQCIDNYAPTVAFVYQRAVYDELRGYDETLGVAEDWEFTIRFLLRYDIDFLDTEEALSFYHHRPEATGTVGNSVFAGVDRHKYNLNLIANRYLRDELNRGTLGVGYLMNKLRYEDEKERYRQEMALQRTVRLEGHMNHVSEEIKHAMSEDARAILRRLNLFHQETVYRKLRALIGRAKRAMR